MRYLLSAALTGVFAVVVFSAAVAQGETLTLEESIAWAITNNSSLKASRAEAMASDEEVSVAKTRFFPTLRTRAFYRWLDRPEIFVINQGVFGAGIPPRDVELSLRNRELYGGSIGLEQPLFMGGQLVHSLAHAKELRGAMQNRYGRQRTVVIYEVKAAYLDALREQRSVETLDKVISAKQERLRVLQELRKEGFAQPEDVLLMETSLAEDEFERTRAKNRAAFALSRLKSLLSYPEEREVTLQERPFYGTVTAPLKELQETALKQRDDLKDARARIAAAKESIGVARADYYPKASVEGRYTRQNETNVTRPEVWLVAGQLDWALFEWGRTRHEVKRAEMLRQKQQYEADEVARAVRLETEEAWRIIKNSEHEVAYREKQLKTAEFRLQQAMNRYRERSIRLADLMESEADFIRAYNEYLTSITTFGIAMAQLERAVSILRDRWIVPVQTYSPDLSAISNKIKGLMKQEQPAPETR